MEIFFGTTKQYHAMEKHTMEIHVSRGLTIIVMKMLSDLKQVGKVVILASKMFMLEQS